MKKLPIGVLNAVITASLLAGCGGSNAGLLPKDTTSAGLPSAQNQKTAAATMTITVPKATSSSTRHAMYISPSTQSMRVQITQVDGHAASTPDTVATIKAGAPGCSTDPATQALSCVVDPMVPVGANVSFHISTFASTDGTGAVLSEATLTKTIVANAANPIAISLGGVVSKVAFSPPSIPVYADGSGYRYQIFVNAQDASGATIIGNANYQSPISLSIQNDPAGALTMTNMSLTGPGSSFYLTYDSSKYLDGASVTATDGTAGDGSTVQTQLFINPLSFSQKTQYGTYGIVQGTPYSITVHEKMFTGTYTATTSDPAAESVAVSPTDANGNATVTITPSSVNSGYSVLTISDGTVSMPIGTQVIPNNPPTINSTHLPFSPSAPAHNQPFRLLGGPAGSTDLWFAGTENGILGDFSLSTHTVSNYYTVAAPGHPTPEYMQWVGGTMWFANADPTLPSIGSFDTNTHTFSSYTAGLSSQSMPFGMIVGPDGKLWFSDRGPLAQSIGSIDPANPSAGATEYNCSCMDPGSSLPGALTIGPDNNIWFADTAYGTGSHVTGAVGVLDMTTHKITEFSSGLPPGYTDEEDGPDGMVSDGSLLWFIGTGPTVGYVGSIDPATKQIQLYTAGFQLYSEPQNLMISKDRKTLWFITSGADPLHDSGGEVYGIAKFDIASKRVTEYRNNQPYAFVTNPPAHEPADFTYGPDGNLYFSDSVYNDPTIGEVVCAPGTGC